MYLTDKQLKIYQEKGFVLLPSCFSATEVEVMISELPAILAEDTPGKVFEKDGKNVRMLHNLHNEKEVFRRLSQHPQLVENARQLLGSEVYIHQFKLNAKVAFDGDVWTWHQDYVFWQQEDGIPTARMVNAFIFLDEINEFNGPLLIIPGSHKEGVISMESEDRQYSTYKNDPSWISQMTTRLKYSTDRETVTRLVTSYGIEAPKGPAGSVLFFHPNCVHGSASNMSPFDRKIAIITYNSVDNLPVPVENPRPEFLASRDYRPLESRTEF